MRELYVWEILKRGKLSRQVGVARICIFCDVDSAGFNATAVTLPAISTPELLWTELWPQMSTFSKFKKQLKRSKCWRLWSCCDINSLKTNLFKRKFRMAHESEIAKFCPGMSFPSIFLYFSRLCRWPLAVRSRRLHVSVVANAIVFLHGTAHSPLSRRFGNPRNPRQNNMRDVYVWEILKYDGDHYRSGAPRICIICWCRVRWLQYYCRLITGDIDPVVALDLIVTKHVEFFEK